MSELSKKPCRILHLVVEGFPAARLEEIAVSSPGPSDVTEIFQLTEATAREALGKIFTADTVAVWGKI
jgi:hypothetical protein